MPPLTPQISLFLFFFGGSGGYSWFCFGLPLSYIWKFISFEVDFGSKSITVESELFFTEMELEPLNLGDSML